MPGTHLRNESTEGGPLAKKLKSGHAAESSTSDAPFATGLLENANVERLQASYRESQPYRHVVVDKLFQEDLLSKVKDECINELSFTEKETDIYKVHQTGDLASLSYLSEEQIVLLPNLLKLRDALYSPTFRSFVRDVTGCGPLSGSKQDMSVNSYKKGCHLLNHDDVIGSRRVSYILYMPLPQTDEWKPEWGGALELYPVKLGIDGIEEPEPMPSKTIPPSWNQFVFFEVQPGHSFHSVEEVVVDEADCSRQRLSISGWFHKAQEGEEGYEGEELEKPKSSLEQLTSSVTLFAPYPDTEEIMKTNPFKILSLTEEHISFLSAFMDPIYLQMKTIKALSAQFVQESSLELHKFLCEPLAKKLESGLRQRDARDGLDVDSRAGRVHAHTCGVNKVREALWTLRGPPHKARYCILSPAPTKKDHITDLSAPGIEPERLLQCLQDILFPSAAFRAWLTLVVSLFPLKYAVEARRFRPGLDYTLATSNEEESVLDVVLGLTPEAESVKNEKEERAARKTKGKGKGKAKEQDESEDEEEPLGWERGEWGGWECYMAPHDGNEDPAVYRSGSRKAKPTIEEEDEDQAHQNGKNGPVGSSSTSSPKVNASEGTGEKHDDEDKEMVSFELAGSESDDEDEDEDEDGTLLTVQPGFNRLLLVLRDEGVMRFVKYVSASAPGSRWDVCGEYEVYTAEEDSAGSGEGEGEEEN